MARYAWGIDIGDGALKAVRAVATKSGFEIVRAHEIPYHDPFISRKKPAALMDRRAAAALIQFANAAAIQEKDLVAVGFPSFNAFEGYLKPPRIGSEDVEKIVAFEVADILSLPPEGLDIAFVARESRSQKAHRIQALVTVRREVDTFMRHLSESGIPWDHVFSAPGALFVLLRLTEAAPGDYVVLSPGLTATSLLVTRRMEFWSKTLPVALPLPPGEGADMARDKTRAVADRLAVEMQKFTMSVFGEKEFKPRKVLMSGEGSRIPGLLNALDSRIGLPVETLKLDPVVAIDPDARHMPPKEVVASMGKAAGLAIGALSEVPHQIPLRQPAGSRRVARALPALTCLTLLLLLVAMGFKGIEIYRESGLEDLDNRFESLVPRELSMESDRILAEIDVLASELEHLAVAARASRDARIPGTIISRFESPSRRGNYGDYHLVELVLDSEDPDARTLAAVVATRLIDEQTVNEEMKELFGAQLIDPEIIGPYPSGEVQPPENMSPLVHYRISGAVKKSP